MTLLVLYVMRDNQLIDSAELSRLPFSIGSQRRVDLRLEHPSIAPHHGTIYPGPEGIPEFRERESGQTTVLSPGAHLCLGPFGLTLLEEESKDDAAGERSLIEHLLAALPRLWEGEDPRSFFQGLLEVLNQAFDAEWSAVLERSDSPQPRVLVQAGRRSPGMGEGVSRTVLDRLRETGAPVLATDLMSDPELAAARSIPNAIRSVLAVPLGGEGPAGALYLESPSSRRCYTERELGMLQSVSGFVAENLRHLQANRQLATRNRRLETLQRMARTEAEREHSLIGSGAAMTSLHADLERAAETEVTVLILGESGTGKELVARELHARSQRAEEQMVPVHCMAFAENLVEDELFGHCKGAFSGAEADRPGRFELAHRGTLFLDELGELSPSVQIKMLRVLEEGVLNRLGENKERRVDVRLLAATNTDLEAAVRAGRFREDLFYRVSVFVLRVPALRDRLEDLPELCDAFLRRFARRYRRPIRGFTNSAQELLGRHSWPGNVRELRNVVEQAVVRARGEMVEAEDLALVPASLESSSALPVLPDKLDEARRIWEHSHLTRILREENGDVPAAARRLGVSRSSAYKRYQDLGIDPRSLRIET